MPGSSLWPATGFPRTTGTKGGGGGAPAGSSVPPQKQQTLRREGEVANGCIASAASFASPAAPSFVSGAEEAVVSSGADAGAKVEKEVWAVAGAEGPNSKVLGRGRRVFSGGFSGVAATEGLATPPGTLVALAAAEPAAESSAVFGSPPPRYGG